MNATAALSAEIREVLTPEELEEVEHAEAVFRRIFHKYGAVLEARLKAKGILCQPPAVFVPEAAYRRRAR